MKKMILSLVVGSTLLSCSLLKRSSKSAVAPGVQSTLVNANIKPDSVKKGIKPYNEIITAKAITQTGLFKVHKVDDKWFFEIPDSLFNRDILVVNRISKAPPFLGYGGDQIGENVIQFAKGPNNKVFIKQMFFVKRSDDSSANSMEKAIANSNYQPISAVFDVKTISRDSSAVVIDLTEYFNGDNNIFFFGNLAKGSLGFGLESYLPDKSFVAGIRSFPLNVELKTVKTYAKRTYTLTFELNSSIVLLPKEPMKPRYLDKRIGYFEKGYYDFNSDRPVNAKWLITKWRLEPRPEDLEKYRRGELVEPARQIVYYIDPATPKIWVPYLMQGVNDWQKAFEKAGFKNAIVAKQVPEGDSTWSLEDASHSVIVYKASEIKNASGPQVSDPRSGEILETHINWFHNIQELMHDWYMVQAGTYDPRARKMQFDDSLMGQLIRYVCAHEVGHTLGLKHNFLSSATVPTDSLRSRNYIKKNGYCPSIMDYARFNYVAQPEDGFSPEELMPRIGMYDEWAIEWGYKCFPDLKQNQEEFFENWVTNKLKEDKRFWFGVETIPWVNLDPSRQSEDLGDDAVKAGYYGIQNLKRIVPQLREWTKAPMGDYESFRRINRQVWDQYFRYLSHVATRLGGVIWTEKYANQEGESINYPSRKQQKDAIQFLNTELFTTPTWLNHNDIYRTVSSDPSYVDFPGYFNLINIVQRTFMDRIMSHKVTNSLLVAQVAGKGDYYTVDELFADLEKSIFSELQAKKNIDIYRRNLQKLYVERLIQLISGFYSNSNIWDTEQYPVITITDVYPVIKDHLKNLLKIIDQSLPAYHDKTSRLHLVEMRDRIKTYYEQTRNAARSGTGNGKGQAFNFNNTDLQQQPDKLSNDFMKERVNNCWNNELPFSSQLYRKDNF